MLMVDTGLVGGMVQPVAMSLIGELKEKEQMSIVSFDSSAEMIQDFTESRQALGAALAKVKYGNTPRVLDALYAAMDGGFDHATFRRVILLVTAGIDGGNRLHEREIVRLARKNSVSIYPVYAAGSSKSLFENLARQTGGASLHLRDLQKTGGSASPAARIFDVVRGAYTLTITGNLGLGEKVKVEIKGREKLNVWLCRWTNYETNPASGRCRRWVRFVITGLENGFQAELEVAGRADSRDLAEGAVADLGVDVGEIHMVGDVERFDAQL